MTDFSRISKEELKKILDDAEENIAQIRAELEQRDRREQHAAVDALELHLERAQVRWPEVRAFFQQVLAELRGSSK